MKSKKACYCTLVQDQARFKKGNGVFANSRNVPMNLDRGGLPQEHEPVLSFQASFNFPKFKGSVMKCSRGRNNRLTIRGQEYCSAVALPARRSARSRTGLPRNS